MPVNRLNHLVVPETQVVFRVDSGFLTSSAIQVFNDANLITALALRAAAIASTLSSPSSTLMALSDRLAPLPLTDISKRMALSATR